MCVCILVFLSFLDTGVGIPGRINRMGTALETYENMEHSMKLYN